MPHANAALTPRARLRLAKLIGRRALARGLGREDVHGLLAHRRQMRYTLPGRRPCGDDPSF